jgi:hypothetical protein
MKKSITVLMILAFCSCSKEAENNENVTTESIEKTPNLQEFSKISKAIDNINVKSKISIEEQMVAYLDENYDENYRAEFAKAKSNQKTSLTKKGGATDEAVDLDKELNDAGFTEVQKEFITRTTALYPLDESEDVTKETSIDVESIKTGLLNIRNEVYGDTRLDITQKEQLYTYIDLQYATLGSIVNYAEKVAATAPLTGKLKFSFKKFVNIVVSVIITTAVGAVLAAVVSFGNPVGVLVGAGGGFVSGTVSAFNNSCIKICGTGYCHTDYDDCYTNKYLTGLFKYN